MITVVKKGWTPFMAYSYATKIITKPMIWKIKMAVISEKNRKEKHHRGVAFYAPSGYATKTLTVFWKMRVKAKTNFYSNNLPALFHLLIYFISIHVFFINSIG